MQIRVSLNPALGLSGDSRMGVIRLLRVGTVKVLNVAQAVIITDESSSKSTLYKKGNLN